MAHLVSIVAHMVHTAQANAAFAVHVKADIESSGLSLHELSARTGISRVTLTRRIAGSPFLSTELFALADVLGLSVADWFRMVEASSPASESAR